MQNYLARRGHSSSGGEVIRSRQRNEKTLDRRGGVGLQVSLRGLHTFLRISFVERFADGTVMS